MSASLPATERLSSRGITRGSWLGRLRRRFFGIDESEVTLERRGFRAGSDAARHRLERIGRTFLAGYHAAVESGDPDSEALKLLEIENEWRGFAIEGAAMGLYLLDRLQPPAGGTRCRRYLRGTGDAHAYMVHVGAGWVLARVPLARIERTIARFDPLLRWLMIEGYAFHQAYFQPARHVIRQEQPRALRGYALRAFDMGLGRALWFVEGCDITALTERVARFSPQRQGELWSGIGLAVAYAGGACDADALRLRAAAGAHAGQLAQGAAFAAKARQRAGNMAAHTIAACRALCGISAEQAAAVTDRCLCELADEGALPAFEVWRRRIQHHFETRKEAT